jgi:hypothetical protein
MNSVSSGPSARESHVENSKQDELRLLINSRSPIITIETAEEERLQGLLQKIAEQLLVPLYVWSVTTGIERAGGAPIYNSAGPEQALANIAEIKGDAMFLLRDFARYCENDRISRRLRDLVDSFRTSRRSIVFSGALIELPPELRGDSVPFQLGLPSASELLPCVNQVLAETGRNLRVTLDSVEIAQVARNLVGFTQDEAIRTLRKCVLARGKADAGLPEAVAEAKREALRADGLLEFLPSDHSFATLRG